MAMAYETDAILITVTAEEERTISKSVKCTKRWAVIKFLLYTKQK